MRVQNLANQSSLYLAALFALFTLPSLGFSIFLFYNVGLNLYSLPVQILILLVLIANLLIVGGLAIGLVYNYFKVNRMPVKYLTLQVTEIENSLINLFSSGSFSRQYIIKTNNPEILSFKISRNFYNIGLAIGNTIEIEYIQNPFYVKSFKVLK